MSLSRENQTDVIYRCVLAVLGSAGVGKTSLIDRLLDRPLNAKYEPTSIGDSGVVSGMIKVKIKNKTILFRPSDAPSKKEQFQAIKKILLPSSNDVLPPSNVALIVYDVTNQTSFDDIEFWVKEVKTASPTTGIFLVGNKIDLTDARVISEEQLKEKALALKTLYIEIDIKNNKNIKDLFDMVMAELEANPDLFSTLPPITSQKPPLLLSPAPLEKKPFYLSAFLKKHVSTIAFFSSLLLLGSLFGVLAFVAWPAMLALPAVTTCALAIAGLNIGVTVPGAAAAILGIITGLTGLATVLTGSYLASKAANFLTKLVSPRNKLALSVDNLSQLTTPSVLRRRFNVTDHNEMSAEEHLTSAVNDDPSLTEEGGAWAPEGMANILQQDGQNPTNKRV